MKKNIGKSIWAVVAGVMAIIIGVAGGYLTARLAPDRPLRHALILGYVGIVLGLIGVIATWNLGLGPRWYPISLVVLAVPQCWLGGWLRERQVQGAVSAVSAIVS